MKQEAKLVTYVAGPVKSTVDCIMVRQEDICFALQKISFWHSESFKSFAHSFYLYMLYKLLTACEIQTENHKL